LDAVEHDRETFVVTRGGKAIASIGPAKGGGGRELKNVLLRHRPDPDWGGELRILRQNLVPEKRSWRA